MKKIPEILPITEEIVDYSRVYSLYYQIRLKNKNIDFLAEMIKRSREEIQLILSNPTLKNKAMRLDRYYYIYRLEKDFGIRYKK